MKSTNTYSLREAFDAFLKTHDYKNKVNEKRIADAWKKLMGKPIVSHTREIYLVRNILFVGITSAALREEMLFSKTKIIEMLNNELKTTIINDIVFK